MALDGKVADAIARLKNWDELIVLERNILRLDVMSSEVARAINDRATSFGREHVVRLAGLKVDSMTQAQQRILDVIGEYWALQKRAGKQITGTIKQVVNRGLINAAESSVCRRNHTLGFQNLADAELETLSYEKIVVDFPEAFSARATWFSRSRLGLSNDAEEPPASDDADIHARTTVLLNWVKGRVSSDSGRIAAFANIDAAAALDMQNLKRNGKAYGNIQSRVDFACYRCGLPPLGLTASEPFPKAWSSTGCDWDFPIAAMTEAARTWKWSNEDFERVLHQSRSLPGVAWKSWQEALAVNEDDVRRWAYGLAAIDTVGQDAGSNAEGDAEPANSSSRNPDWTRDELILALYLYLCHRKLPLTKNSSEIQELSDFLSRLGVILAAGGKATFRNVNGVYMKLMNFRRFDPEFANAGKVGLSKGNKDEEIVWGEFFEHPDQLKAIASAIRAAVDGGFLPASSQDDDDCVEGAEGRILTRVHRIRERNRKLVGAKKNSVLKALGRLCCEACGFDFGKVYGAHAQDVIDCHHTKPVHTLVEGDRTRIEDLALLCANCHRVVHAKKVWLSIAELRAMLQLGTRLT